MQHPKPNLQGTTEGSRSRVAPLRVGHGLTKHMLANQAGGMATPETLPDLIAAKAKVVRKRNKAEHLDTWHHAAPRPLQMITSAYNAKNEELQDENDLLRQRISYLERIVDDVVPTTTADSLREQGSGKSVGRDGSRQLPGSFKEGEGQDLWEDMDDEVGRGGLGRSGKGGSHGVSEVDSEVGWVSRGVPYASGNLLLPSQQLSPPRQLSACFCLFVFTCLPLPPLL